MSSIASSDGNNQHPNNNDNSMKSPLYVYLMDFTLEQLIVQWNHRMKGEKIDLLWEEYV